MNAALFSKIVFVYYLFCKFVKVSEMLLGLMLRHHSSCLSNIFLRAYYCKEEKKLEIFCGSFGNAIKNLVSEIK